MRFKKGKPLKPNDDEHHAERRCSESAPSPDYEQYPSANHLQRTSWTNRSGRWTQPLPHSNQRLSAQVRSQPPPPPPLLRKGGSGVGCSLSSFQLDTRPLGQCQPHRPWRCG